VAQILGYGVSVFDDVAIASWIGQVNAHQNGNQGPGRRRTSNDLRTEIRRRAAQRKIVAWIAIAALMAAVALGVYLSLA
jgi:hypothetical protein